MSLALTPAQRAVVLSGVPGASSSAAGPPVVVDQEELLALIPWATSERVAGLLRRAVHAGELALDPDVPPSEHDKLSAAIDEAVLTAARNSLAAEATGVAAILALRSAGIESVPFKGLATAHTDYGDPSERSFFDADVLVPRKDLAAAVDVLADSGFRRAAPAAMRPAWERRFARAVELRHVNGVELDLHAAIATGYFGQVLDHDLIRMDLVDIELGGSTCRVFGPTARFLISAYAVVLSRGPNLRLYADLARQLIVTEADWRRANEWAGVGESVIAEALCRLGAQLDIQDEAIEWAHGIVPSATARRALDFAEAGESEGWSADARSAVLGLGWVDRGRFVAGVAERQLRRRRPRRSEVGMPN